MLHLYNSLTKQLDPFILHNKKKITLYVCGITPYDTTHVGHAFTYLSFDVLVRYLQYLGNTVIYTQNVTDINDRDNDILKKAQEQHIPWQDLASFWTKKFLDDMVQLNWITPTHYLKASEQIPNMIALTGKIIKSGTAYIVDGNVFLDTETDADFGKLSRLTKEQMHEKAKEFEEDLQNPLKKHPLDITLWRASDTNQSGHIPSFNSPWGPGRPGWHIECSAMVISSLGEQIDIHGGGIDLIYPHHESEIAQSEAGTSKKPFAKYWMHTGTVGINGQKMSKSLGNLILISDLLKTYSANAIRWVLLSHHYRSAWEYNEAEFKQAEEILSLISTQQSTGGDFDITNFKQQALEALNNDLDVPSVLQLCQQRLNIADAATIADMKQILTLLGFIL